MKGWNGAGPPPIGKALVDWLEVLYPDRLPKEEVTLTQLAYLRGQRDLVRMLRDWHEAQHKTGR